MSRIIVGAVRIPNHTDDPVPLSKSQKFAQIRRVMTPQLQGTEYIREVPIQRKLRPQPHSMGIQLDPDNQLSTEEMHQFNIIHIQCDDVFNSNVGVYNDFSGTIRGKVNLGRVIPPPRKGKLPFYTNSNLQLLRDEADKLEALGMLAKPEDVGVEVKYVSPSFLVKKPDSNHRLVTAFDNLSKFIHVVKFSEKYLLGNILLSLT